MVEIADVNPAVLALLPPNVAATAAAGASDTATAIDLIDALSVPEATDTVASDADAALSVADSLFANGSALGALSSSFNSLFAAQFIDQVVLTEGQDVRSLTTITPEATEATTQAVEANDNVPTQTPAETTRTEEGLSVYENLRGREAYVSVVAAPVEGINMFLGIPFGPGSADVRSIQPASVANDVITERKSRDAYTRQMTQQPVSPFLPLYESLAGRTGANSLLV